MEAEHVNFLESSDFPIMCRSAYFGSLVISTSK